MAQIEYSIQKRGDSYAAITKTPLKLSDGSVKRIVVNGSSPDDARKRLSREISRHGYLLEQT